jgi:hypothetical protein
MTHALVPCSRCARHVRAREGSCPFCGATIDAALAAKATAAAERRVPRMGRAAVVAFGASVALAACGGSASGSTADQDTPDHVTAGDESGNTGGHGEDPNAAHDPEGSDGVHDDAAAQPHPDEGAPVAAYGAPAPDTTTPE